ncbi:MAG: DUF1330 domain-containing protein [Chloroflexota bacterium]
MAAYFIFNYNVTDAEKYNEYRAAVGKTLASHEVKVLVAHEGETIEGSPQPMMIILEFTSKQAAHAWYDSEAYREVIHLREESTENGIAVLADSFSTRN